MPKKKKLTMEDAAQEWLDIKAKKIALEKRIDELRECLEPYLEELPEKSTVLCGHKFTLVSQEREFFQLAHAREKLEEKVLKPFIKVSQSQFIRTTWQGDEDAST